MSLLQKVVLILTCRYRVGHFSLINNFLFMSFCSFLSKELHFFLLTIVSISIPYFIYKTEQYLSLFIENMSITPII
jgi:hypothetical protein